MEEKYWTYITQQQIQYDDLSHHVRNLSKLLNSFQDRSQALTSHLHHFSAKPTYRYHPYSPSQALIGPGIVCFFSWLISILQLTNITVSNISSWTSPKSWWLPSIQRIFSSSPDHFSPPSSIPYLSTPPPYRTTSPSESLSPTCLSNLNGTCQSQHLQRGQGECEYSSQTIKHMVPELGWNLRGCAWEQIVEDWDYPDPSRSLFVAMKNWDSSFFQSKAEEMKFGQRQVIALEFINVSVFSCTRY